MEYLNAKRAKSKSPPRPLEQAEPPVLNDEDEAFLHRIATEGTPPELPERPPPPLPHRPQNLPEAGEPRGNDAQIALMDNAQNIPLPDVSDTADDDLTRTKPDQMDKGKGKERAKQGKKSRWSFLRRDSRDIKRKATATDLMSVAEGLKAPDAQTNEDGTVSDSEARKEEEEMATVLDQLNLAAVNNRVFSVSKESQELLHKYSYTTDRLLLIS